jgi:hypothetical protein
MAQVNYEPGVSQAPTLVVVPFVEAVGPIGTARTTARLKTVTYAQTEPGRDKILRT